MLTLLLAVSLLANTITLASLLYRWWRRSTPAARGLALLTALAYASVWAGIRAIAGPLAAWILGLAGIGLLGTVAGVLIVTGWLAVHHAERTAAAIAAGKIKELSR